MTRLPGEFEAFFANRGVRLCAAVFAVAAMVAISAGYLSAGRDSFAASAAQTQIKGQWIADFGSKKGGEQRVQLSFIRRSASGDNNNIMGESYSLSELQGLSAEAAGAANSVVSFNIVREAGTFACEGTFRGGKGAGVWTFTPNAGFVSAMSSRGFANLSDEDILRAAMHNLTSKYIDDLRAAGYNNLTFEDYSRGAGHDVTLDYIREMQAAGYPGLKLEELIRARNHDIDSRYVKEVAAMGFEKQTLDDVIHLKNHDINQQFIDEMKSVGFENLTAEELVRLRNHDITPAYVNDLRSEGFNNITADLAIRAMNHEIDRDFIQRAKAQGYANASLDELIRLRNKGTVK